MPINPARIAAAPVTPRNEVVEQPVRIARVNPGEVFSYRDEDGSFVRDATFEPSYEGELYVNVVKDGINRTGLMYVAVSIEGVLEWKIINSYYFVDKYTGQSKDPIYDYDGSI